MMRMTMTGKKFGVKTRILNENEKALFVHCFNHSLNLAVSGTLKKTPLLKDNLSICKELIDLIKKSAKREASLKHAKMVDFDTSPGIRTLCPTKWTVKYGALNSIILNYSVLLEVFEEAFMNETVPEMKARRNGVCLQMMEFDFFFGISLTKVIFLHLARSLQKKDLSALEGNKLYQLTFQTLKDVRANDFENFYSEVLEKSEKLELNELKLPRRRKTPVRYIDSDDEDESINETPTTAKDY